MPKDKPPLSGSDRQDAARVDRRGPAVGSRLHVCAARLRAAAAAAPAGVAAGSRRADESNRSNSRCVSAEHSVPRPQPLDDAAFLRRVYLDLVGLLPTRGAACTPSWPTTNPAKREQLIDRTAGRQPRLRRALAHVLERPVAERLRRHRLHRRRPQADQRLAVPRARATTCRSTSSCAQLIAPSPESEGFIHGIKWRGNVNASQKPELQFAQNVSQVFLGINMKCASCHDSFIDRWTLAETYGLAAITADGPLEALSLRQADRQDGRGRVDVPRAGPDRSASAARRTAAAAGRTDDRPRERPLHADDRQSAVAPADGPRHRASGRCHADRAVERRPAGLSGRAPGRQRLRFEEHAAADRDVAGVSVAGGRARRAADWRRITSTPARSPSG